MRKVIRCEQWQSGQYFFIYFEIGASKNFEIKETLFLLTDKKINTYNNRKNLNYVRCNLYYRISNSFKY